MEPNSNDRVRVIPLRADILKKLTKLSNNELSAVPQYSLLPQLPTQYNPDFWCYYLARLTSLHLLTDQLFNVVLNQHLHKLK